MTPLRTDMQKLAFVIALLPIAACSTSGLTAEQKKLGIKNVSSLSSDYESGSFWAHLRQRNDGRANAFGRDLQNITDFIDRHIWNYDVNDPYVNYPTDTGRFTHVGRFGASLVTSTPVVGDTIVWTDDLINGK